ncbi:hypothetical protein Ancab_005071, partial [Ancistrocladus abbreviatus]
CNVNKGFIEPKGEDSVYYEQTFSMILDGNSKKSTIDVDLSSLDDGMNIQTTTQHPRQKCDNNQAKDEGDLTLAAPFAYHLCLLSKFLFTARLNSLFVEHY